MSIAFFVAGRYLRSKQCEGFVSVIAYMAVGGVILGVAALVIILSVTNGFAGEIKSRLIGMNAHVNIRRFDGGPIKDWRALVERVQGYAEVVGAAQTGASTGPGRGLQLSASHRHAPNRLLFIGHRGAYQQDFIWFSDDGGASWTTSLPFLGNEIRYL